MISQLALFALRHHANGSRKQATTKQPQIKGINTYTCTPRHLPWRAAPGQVCRRPSRPGGLPARLHLRKCRRTVCKCHR